VNDADVFRYHEYDFIFYLYNQLLLNGKITIFLNTEGYSCKDGSDIFRILEDFCRHTKYTKENVTIITGNMLETHQFFNIKHDHKSWYEVPLINKWLSRNDISDIWGIDKTSVKIGSFVGGSKWYRLWISGHLYKFHKKSTVQTFHSSLTEDYTFNDSLDPLADDLGFQELVLLSKDVNLIADSASFLKNCPLIYTNDDSAYIKNNQDFAYIKSNNKLHGYPIQFPTNMNILSAYKSVFVDVVQETVVSDETFFLTEKTWRPIIAKKPFIIMSSVYTLHNLQVLGFKTFDNFWDEGYDEYGYVDRVLKILNLIDNISTWSNEKKIKKLTQMRSILDHNYNTFKKLTTEQIYDSIPKYKRWHD